MGTRQALFELLDRELSGEKAQKLTCSLSDFYRSPGATGYHLATRLAEQELRRIGLDVTVERYPLDGRTELLGRAVPRAWEPIGAELTVIEPEVHHLVSYDEAPSCIPWWSSSTPAGGAEYELVDVGTGESVADFEGRDVAGKAVFIRGTERRDGWNHAARLAVERGAAGIVTDYLLYPMPPWRTRESVPDAVQLLRLPVADSGCWALAIDHHASQTLRRLLAAGRVRIHANVQCRTWDGEGINLTGSIPGSRWPDESVYVITHTTAGTKPGANCAGGVALSLEVARTLQALIESGQVPRPRRSIKFLYVVEGIGSLYLFHHHPEERDAVVAAFNLDSVGHDQNKLKSALLFYRVPDSVPHFLNDYCAALMDEVPKEASWVFRRDRSVSLLSFEQKPYTPWSDNHYWNEFQVPCALIMSWPDIYFHTQLLTPDNTDPAVFRRAGLLISAALLELADAGAPQALEAIQRVVVSAEQRLGQVVADALRDRPSGAGAPGVEERIERIRYLAARDTEAVKSALRLVRREDEATRRQVEDFAQQAAERLARRAEQEIELLRTLPV